MSIKKVKKGNRVEQNKEKRHTALGTFKLKPQLIINQLRFFHFHYFPIFSPHMKYQDQLTSFRLNLNINTLVLS